LAADDNRRPLKTRSRAWAHGLARVLIRVGAAPNGISVAGVLFAALGAAALFFLPNGTGLVAGAVCVQLRLLCNMLDGLVAIEGGRRTATGLLYNEIPDRLEDSLLLVALGYAAGEGWLGWLGALAASLTAYIRVLGGSCGFPQDFRGPLAKQHRMFVMTVGCLLGAIELQASGNRYSLLLAAWIIAVGALLTCARRARAIAVRLRAHAS
jgi:phosphatidylglycerophosphate synthase